MEMFTSEMDDVSVWVRSYDGQFSRGTLYMVDRRTGRAGVLLDVNGVQSLENVSTSQLYTDRAESEHTDVPKRTTDTKKADAPPVVAR